MAISSALAVGSGTTTEQSASRIVAVAAAGSHTLTFHGYSSIKKQSTRSGGWIPSAPFTAGGHTWSAEFRCDGWKDRHGHCWIRMLLRHRCAAHCGDVQARYTFTILDQNGRQPVYSESSGNEVDTFTTTHSCGVRAVRREGRCLFDEPRATTYLRDDCLTFRCDVTVYKELRTEDIDVPTRLVPVPPSDIGEQLGRLLSTGVGADLTFEVAGQTMAAHKHILALRSPALLEEIITSGVIMETRTSCGTQICGMEAVVVKALLHYVYTDSLPEMDDEGDMMMDMVVRQLIAAANRYSLDRLKLICENMLCRRVDASRVAATLALAEEYSCHGLKKACFQFLMSGSNLKAAMTAGGFEHLRSSCPSVLKELLAMVDRR